MARFLIVLTCFLLLQVSKASCQEKVWIFFSGNEHTDKFYFNTRNIVKTETTILVWVECVLSKESMDKEQGKFGDLYDMSKTKYLLDFKNKKFKIMATYDYLGEKNVGAFNYENTNSWEDIIPSTFMENELLVLEKYLHIED